MKIMMAIKRLEDMAGGAERVFLQIAESLSQNGYDITLLSFDRKDAESFYPAPNNLEWIKLGIGDSSKPAKSKETLGRMLSLRTQIKKTKPDLIIAFQHSMFIPLCLAKLGIQIPVIASEHIVPMHYKSKPLEYALLTLTGLMCKKITVLSDEIIKLYPKILQRRMVAIANPVITTEQKADLAGKNGSPNTLLSVGRLDPQKDQKTLISAFAQIAEEFPDWNLRIIGEGHLRPKLEQQIKDLRLSSRISLPGISKDIQSEYLKAQAFVLASTYESFGLATAEAMSTGLPVIGFADCEGTNKLINHNKTGILVDPKNRENRIEALAKELSSILSNPEKRYLFGKNGKEWIAEKFNSEKITTEWVEIIQSIDKSA
ncbi:MAG: glycosyltransferase family 4 protein [Alphaproteobacteria bacterium]|nr:glycosyltransferase family 4 protein [Alphaproteobacteria bacterium]